MRLIVGLGNPGIEYAWTPHNLGFLVVDKLAEQANIRVTRREAKSFVGRGKIAGHEVVIAKPQTMMNLSGLAVRELVGRAECESSSDLIVICDDIALPWGMLRVRERGSAGGHNGLKSVIGALGTMEFPRVRLGVQPAELKGDLKQYVLRQIRRDEEDVVAEEVEQGAEAVKMIVAEGTARAMNHFNRRVPSAGGDEDAE
jgi:PTH1 family peptidyl-tRNA hydrolase